MMKGKWYILALSFVLGYLPSVIGFLSIILLFIIWRKVLMKNRLLLFLTLISFISSYLTTPSLNSTELQQPINYEGWVSVKTNPEHTETDLRFVAETPELGQLYLFANSDSKTIKHGSKCLVQTQLEEPMDATNPGQFSYKDYLATLGIFKVGFQTDIIQCHNRSMLSYIFEFRDSLQQRLKSELSTDTFIWLNALIFGERDGIDEATIEQFQYWNISHILAISGLHVGIVIAVLYVVLLNVVRTTKERAKWVIICFIPLYILLADSQPPVLRAGLMATGLMIWSLFNQKKMDAADILSVVMIILLLTDRYLLFQLSFQFSFAVTFSLILSRNLLQNVSWFMLSLRVSLISQLAILPLQLYYFYFTNVFSFFMNLIYVPYFTLFVIPLLMIIIISIYILPKAMTGWLDQSFSFVQNKAIQLISWFDEPDFAIWIVGQPHVLLMIAYTVLFLFMMTYWDFRRHVKAAIMGVLMVGVFYVPLWLPYLNPTYTITMLDVGQSDSFVVELPYRRGVFLIDAGEEVQPNIEDVQNENFENVIKPYLWSKGISSIDAVWLSHLDYDHSGSIGHVIEEFRPEYLFTHSNMKPLNVKRLNHVLLQHGMTVNYGEAVFQVLAPNPDLNITKENDWSLVFILKVDDYEMLFTGDITKRIETEIIQTGNLESVDVLKVAHHGSKSSTSSEWLEQVDPQLALISVGERNLYGHPHPEIVERLNSNDVQTYRTDLHGAVIIKYHDGQSTIYRFRP
ncbi:DNA internalization-related competence protein ComEC/Rec2 [Tenuibacillus multivorans]|uniref:Competence protein ComEC n=1 Tax=Tenuibacillus multivorans TaxID=237069 RepID=A0A1G9ZHI2_9BACI|nr:DNA internalization-related competence protein ComEC/Rec2 [Tenuibacillus multivorans]GEL78340.1 DNA internalization-related competence protein ComEC/Rec2 [Tenuibacillus multivorans]SDN19963.1 competence protein ComEC [Tenuibacillus multivorans]